MNSTVAQNAAHKLDGEWSKTGKTVHVNGEMFISEYTNGFTGQRIRKDWRMTGQDWIVFDAADNITGRAHSLTWAKIAAKA